MFILVHLTSSSFISLKISFVAVNTS